MPLPSPSNPLSDYIDRPDPYFDYTDARTWYDGLWGGGLWPPEGMRGLGGIGYFTPGFPLGYSPPVFFHTPAFFPGDRSRIMGAAGIRGLGQAGDYVDSMGNCLDSNGNPTGATVNVPSVPLAACSPTGPLRTGQVYCQTGTTMPPPGVPNCYDPNHNVIPCPSGYTAGSVVPTSGMSTQTMVMIGMGVSMALLLILAVRR